jgi:MtN3 and saliva related transmembrane protein
MSQPLFVELIGTFAACLTTFCWLPQTIRTIRTRDTSALSMVSFCFFFFFFGLVTWLFYGILIGSWPVIAANACTIVLNLVIIVQKWRYG